MKPGYHKCPVRRCPKHVMDIHLMCSQHWFKVPAWLQTGIYREYYRGLRLQSHPTREYSAHVEVALAHIANLPAPQGAQPQHA